jgi:hypothetical protein
LLVRTDASAAAQAALDAAQIQDLAERVADLVKLGAAHALHRRLEW